jgi:UDP-N-acetylglucosamine:LPS N-acetylglucosamine transferase
VSRVLILSANVGEGHASVARALAADLETATPGVEVAVSHSLAVLGRGLQRVLERGFRHHYGRGTRSYDLAYRACMELAPVGRAGERALLALGGRALERTIARARPDVVVSTFPVITAVLGGLRAGGCLGLPVLATVSDIVGLRFWVHPGVDRHLVMHPESVPEAARLAGPDRVEVVRPLLRPGFLAPPDRGEARRALELPADARVVAVSGGGWGLGDLPAAIDAVLAVPEVRVLALAGRNAEARERAVRRFADEPRVRVLGFTDRMPQVLAAVDALVHATGGVTALEAAAVGCPLIAHGHRVGHVRATTDALARAGLATVAATPAQLTARIRRVLAEPRPAPRDLAALPSAASRVLAALGAGEVAGGRGERTAAATDRAERAGAAPLSSVPGPRA